MMTDKDKKDAAEKEFEKITDQKMSKELKWFVVLFVAGFLLFVVGPGNIYLGLSHKSRSGIGLMLVGLSSIVSANALSIMMNYMNSDSVPFLRLGPWYFKLIGALFIYAGFVVGLLGFFS